MNKPNILLIMSDQHNKKIMGNAGDKIIKTPNLDDLAKNGIVFNNCYCPAPLCVPSRMSFMSSKYPYETEIWSNACHLSSDIPTFAHSLSAAGYETVLCGRMHFCGPDQRHGFDKRLVGDVTGSYIGSPLPALTHYLLRGAGASRKAVEIAGPGRTGYQLYDETVAETAAEYLKSKSHTKEQFCMVVGFVLPHCPFVCPEDDYEYYYNKIDLPQYDSDYFNNLHPAVKQWRQYFGIEDLSEEEIRKARAGYYGLVAHFDRQVGKILDTLHSTRLADNTIVIYTSDHGEMAGEHGMWWKMNHYDGAASVPFIISAPNIYGYGKEINSIINLVDIGPTLTEIACSDELPDISGNSIIPLLKGVNDEWKNESFTEHCSMLGFPPSRMIRKDQWKLIYYNGYRPQLFNISNDPDEVIDLGDDPEYKSIVCDLTNRILDGWSASRMESVLTKRFRSHYIHVNWFNKNNPEMPELWSPPPGTNKFTGDPDFNQ